MKASFLLALLLLPRPLLAQTLFRFPGVDPLGSQFMEQPIIGVDHDDLEGGERVVCLNYAGSPFPSCYNGHDGTDFLLRAGFVTMDEKVPVVAAADGVVVEAVDGNYDRCHAVEGFQVSCDGHPVVSNRVVIQHAGLLRSGYWHLMKGSVRVKVGEQVRCGQALGMVGSSGNSALPHIHFQVNDLKGNVLDPYAGTHSQPASLWVEQQGPFGRPGDRCQGEAPAREAGTPSNTDGIRPPSSDAGPAPGSDAAAAAQEGQPLACALSPRSHPPPFLILLLGLWLCSRRGPG